MPKSREGSQETEEDDGYTPPSGQEPEVIEVFSDDEEDLENGVAAEDERNRDFPQEIGFHEGGEAGGNDGDDGDDGEDGGDNDDIQITGSNNLNPAETMLNRILRATGHGGGVPRRRVMRRRLNDDDIQIIDERPAERAIGTPNFADLDSIDTYRQSLINRIHENTLETPLGVHGIGADLDELISELERLNEARTRYTSIPRITPPRMLRRSLRRRRLTRPRANVAYPQLEQFEIPEQLFEEFFGPYGDHDRSAVSDRIENTIMARIERDNENALDQKLRNENIFNRDALKEKKDIAQHEKHGYTNDLKPEDEVCCELCGVVLGKGIPEDFHPNIAYDKDFEKFSRQFRVQAPWFCIKQCLDIDRDLSKRAFASKCGHVYCGRCVRNIGSRSTRSKKPSTKLTIDNPLVYAPRKCTASDCFKHFKGKKPFTELYF